MSAPSLVPLIVVAMALKDISDGTTSKIVNLSNMPIPDNSEILPILKGIGSLGVTLDTYLPAPSRSTIRIDNTPGSYGFERRFSDILERYTIVDQNVIVYLKFLAPGTTAYTISSADQIWKAKATSFSIKFQGNSEVQISIAADTIPREVLNYQMSPILFSSSPTQVIGRYLPFVIGQGVDVKPLSVDSGHGTTARFFYATTFYNGYPVAGVDAYYARDSRNSYIEVISAAATSTALLQSAPTSSSFATLQYEKAGELPSTTSANYLLQGGKITLYGDAGLSGTVEGDWTIRLYEAGPVDGPGDTVVATAKVMKTDYTAQIQTTAEFDIDYCFDKFAPIEEGRTYYVGIVDSDPDASTSLSRVRTGTTGTHWGRSPDNGEFVERSGGLQFVFYGVVLTDDPNSDALYHDGKGLAAAFVTATQRSAPSGQTVVDLSVIDFIFNISGFEDDGSGTLSGTPGLLLNAPLRIVRLLDQEWSGSAWAAGKFDFNKFSDSHTNTIDGGSAPYNRGLNGRIDGPATRDFILSEVCRESASRVTLYNGATKQLALYAWGTNRTSARTIEEEDCRVVDYEVRGSDSIVNTITIRYGQNLRYYTALDGLTARQSPDLFAVEQLYSAYSTLGTEMLSESAALFGVRINANPDYPLLSESASVGVMLKYLAARYAIPDIYVTIELLDLNKYAAIDMLDVLTLTSPTMPSYFGTAADAYYPTYTVTAVDLVPGEYWRRAQDTRLQVEGREIFFSENSPPGLRLLCRVLNNYPRDPT